MNNCVRREVSGLVVVLCFMWLAAVGALPRVAAGQAPAGRSEADAPVAHGPVARAPTAHEPGSRSDVEHARVIHAHISVRANEQLATWLTLPDIGAHKAAPVVLLPGVLGSAFSMRHVTAALTERGYTVLVLDLLGMGASDRPARADYSLAAQADRVLAVLDSLKLYRVHIAAHGTSATIALHAAAKAPGRFAQVVSIAGGPVSSQNTGGVQAALRISRLLDTPVGRSLARRKFAAQLRERSASKDWLTDSVLSAYLDPLNSDLRGTLRALQQMGNAADTLDLSTVLQAVKAPVTLLTGSAYTPGAPTSEQQTLLRRHVRTLRISIIAGAGSMLHEETPGEVVRAITCCLRD